MTLPRDDGAFARWLADRAGAELLELRARLGFADPARLRDEGDRRAHVTITAELARLRPGDAVLSEEQAFDDPARLTADRVWIVDPLDGTRGFGRPGRTDWAVQLALWARGRGLVAGAVALPAQQRTVGTDQPPARPSAPSGGGPLRLAVSRTRAPGFLTAVADEAGGELVRMGSAGAKVVAVVTGEADAYLHADGQHEWDSAAPVAVARTAGLHASRVDGTDLEYNQLDPSLPDLLVCRGELAGALLAAVAQHRLH